MTIVTLYKACDNVDVIVESLRMSAEKLFKWFKHNQMKSNTCKCHLILLIYIQEIQMKSSLKIHLLKATSVKNFFGVKFDHQLTFVQHVKSLRQKANTKLISFASVV